MNKKEIMDSIKGGMIVSCQALKGEPLYMEDNSIMYLMARAAKQAGAVGIRTESVRDIIAIKKETNLPVIGIIKKQYPGYGSYISPTMKEIDAIVEAGADIVALDCTLRERGDGLTVNEYIKEIKKKYPHIILMADISNFEEGVNAAEAGVDFVGTTMSGYTEYTEKTDGPDLKLIKALSEKLDVPVIGEGRIHYPHQAKEALDAGAFAIVVGGAITRPLEIAERFIAAIK